ncbi:MAG: type II secretion system F family protein [Paracoccaceae bacterium]
MSTILQIWDFINAALGPMAPFAVLGLMGVYLILLALPIVLKKEEDPFAKLQGAPGARPVRGGGKDDSAAVKLRFDGGAGARLGRFAKHLEPQDEEAFSASRLKLIQAGYRSKTAVRTLNFAKMVLGIGFMLIGVLFVLIQPNQLALTTLIMIVVIPGTIGYVLPMYWVERRLQQRQEDTTNGFPDALDLMLVCVEAGQSLDQAILRVAGEIKKAYPTLSEEYEIVANEMRAGKDRVTVLRDMSERCGVADISAFVTVLVQSAKYGTSIADALRVYASEMRDKRVMRAEEKANVLPTKLTIGTMMFTVPPLLIILVGPSIYNIYENLLQ